MKFTQEDLKQLIKEEMAKLYEDDIGPEEEEAEAAQLSAEEPQNEHRCGGSHGARDDDYVPDMECDCERCASHREGSMARSQLARTSEIAMMLEKMIGEDTDLEEWVESKITKAKDYLSSVLDYMRGEDLVDAGDAARDMKAQAAAMNFGPMEEAEDEKLDLSNVPVSDLLRYAQTYGNNRMFGQFAIAAVERLNDILRSDSEEAEVLRNLDILTRMTKGKDVVEFSLTDDKRLQATVEDEGEVEVINLSPKTMRRRGKDQQRGRGGVGQYRAYTPGIEAPPIPGEQQ